MSVGRAAKPLLIFLPLVLVTVFPYGPGGPGAGAAAANAATADSAAATGDSGTGPADPYEEMLGGVERETDLNLLINNLDTILKQPINLLEAGREELTRLPWISPWLADEIVALRSRGELKDLDDLKRIDSVDQALVDLLRPFVELRPVRRLDAPRFEGMLRARVISQPASGEYRNLKTYLRGQAAYAGWEGGFLIEKDRYESSLNDFQSFYLEKSFQHQEIGSGRIVAGDFLLATGHGLVFSNPYGYAPSTVDPWRFSQGQFDVKPYTSVEENFGLTGAGVAISRGNVDLCFAASRAKYDAALDEEGRVISLGTTGLHVSERELEGRQALREDLFAMALRLGRGGGSRGGRQTGSRGTSTAWATAWRAGIDAAYSRLNRDFSDPRLSWLSGPGTLTGSIDLSLEIRRTVAFAQGALADGGGGALLAGFAFERERMEFLMLGRAYDDTYLSLHARPFAFYSGIATGERGLFTRIGFEPTRRLTVSIGSDVHEKRMPDEGLSRPSGSESFLDVSLKLGDVHLSLGEKLLASSEPSDGEGRPSEERRRLRSRLDARYRARPWLKLRLRYENLRASEDAGGDVGGEDGGGEDGGGEQRSSSDLLRLDADFSRLRPIEVRAGFYVFSVEQYASRIYQYEPGIPYYPVIEMLKSDGSRWYLVLSFDMKRFGRLAAKYGRTEYSGGEDRSGFMFYYSVRT